MKISIKQLGVKKVLRRNKERQNQLANPKKVLNLSALLIRTWIDKNFVAEGGLHENTSLKWLPLSDFTLKMRRKGKGSHSDKILQDTGRLKTGWVIQSTGKVAVVKSAVGYSSTHEHGKGSGAGSIPMRKILPTQKQGQKIVLPAFEAFAKELAK